MNSVDYSRKLDLERANYGQKLNESRRQNEESTKDLKENFENRISSQRDNNNKHKLDLENKFKDSYEVLGSQTKDALLDKQLLFNKKLAEDQKEFDGVRRENHESFNRRYKVLNDSYETAFKDLKETAAERGTDQTVDFRAKVELLEADKEAKLAKFQEAQSESTRKINQDYVLEKDAIIKEKENQFHELVKDEQKKRNFVKDTSVKTVAGLKLEQEESARNGREIANLRFKNLQTNTNDKIRNLDERNTTTINNLTVKSKEDMQASSKDFKEKFTNQARENRQELREMDYRNNVNGVGEDSSNFDILGKTRENEKLSEERRIDVLKAQKNNIEQEYAKRESDAIDSFQGSYRDMRIEMSGKLQDQEIKMADINRVERYKDLKQMADKDDAHARVLFQERNDSSQEIGKNKKLSRERFEKVTKDYSNNLARVELMANAQVDDAKKDAAVDKTKMHDMVESRAREERFTERKLLTDKYNKMEESFQKKVLSLQNKNEETRMQYDNKMQNLVQSTQDDIIRTTKQMKNSTDSQIKLERDNNNSKLKQLRESITVQRSTSDKALNDMRLENTQKINSLTYAYEQKLKGQESKYQGIIDQNKNKASIDKDRLKLATSQEKEAIMEQYEQRLERMEAVNNQKLTNMEKYAGLQVSQK